RAAQQSRTNEIIRKQTTDTLFPDGSVRSISHSADEKLAEQAREEGLAFHQQHRGSVTPEQAFRFTSEDQKRAFEAEYLRIRREERDESEVALGQLQAVLDIAGLLPVVGVAADATSAIVSAGRGNTLAASVSLLAAIPILGDFATAAKVARQAEQALDSL